MKHSKGVFPSQSGLVVRLRSQLGMSLISVMIAIGVSGVLVMVVTQIYQQMQSVAFYAAAQSDLQDGMRTFSLHFAQDSNCSCNFQSQTFNSAAGTLDQQSLSVASIQKFDPSCASPQPLAAVGGELAGVRRLKISSLKMGGFQPLGSTSPPTSYTGEVQVSFDTGSSVLGIPILTRKVPVQVNVADSGGTATVQSCTVIGSENNAGAAANLAEFFEAMDGQKIGAMVCTVDSNEHRCMDDAAAVGLVFEYQSDGVIVKIPRVTCNNNSCWLVGSPGSITFPKVTVEHFENQNFPSLTVPYKGTLYPTDYFAVIADPVAGGVVIKGALEDFFLRENGCPPMGPGNAYSGWVMSPARTSVLPLGPQATNSDAAPAIRALFPGVNLHLSTAQQAGVPTMSCAPPPTGG